MGFSVVSCIEIFRWGLGGKESRILLRRDEHAQWVQGSTRSSSSWHRASNASRQDSCWLPLPIRKDNRSCFCFKSFTKIYIQSITEQVLPSNSSALWLRHTQADLMTSDTRLAQRSLWGVSTLPFYCHFFSLAHRSEGYSSQQHWAIQSLVVSKQMLVVDW